MPAPRGASQYSHFQFTQQKCVMKEMFDIAAGTQGGQDEPPATRRFRFAAKILSMLCLLGKQTSRKQFAAGPPKPAVL